MIKGCQRQLIVLRTGGSRFFDEAYFVLRERAEADGARYTDILKEANRILEESEPERVDAGRRRRPRVCFLVGALCGAALTLMLCLLL